MAKRSQELSTRLALEQAQKSAEALFETKSIADIKKVDTLFHELLQNVLCAVACTHTYHCIALSGSMHLGCSGQAGTQASTLESCTTSPVKSTAVTVATSTCS